MSYNIRIIDLYKSDPLLKFLTKKLNIDPIIIISRIFMIQLVLIFINYYVSYILYRGEQIIGVFDQEYNLFEALIMPLVCVPLLWYGYLWQPKVIDHVFSSFMQNNLIIESEMKRFRNFIIGMENMVNSYYTIIVALSLSIIFLYIFIFKVDPIQAVVTEDKIPYWFYFDKRYYYLFHIPVVFIFSIYPLLMLFTKFILIFIYLNKFLLEFKLRIRPLHPDECGGLGNLGHMITVYGIFIVVLGIAMTILSKLGRTYFTIDVIFGYLLYIICMCLAGQYARQHLEAIQSSQSPRCQCRHDPLVNRSPFLISQRAHDLS